LDSGTFAGGPPPDVHLAKYSQLYKITTNVKDMWVGRELIDDLSSGSMPDLYTAVGGECGAAELQQQTRPRAFGWVVDAVPVFERFSMTESFTRSDRHTSSG
jgi:hypothetical protein